MGIVSGKILRVNLTTKKISEECAEHYEERFIGGRGVGAWILLNEMKSEITPLDPASILVFCAGPLTGTDFPGAARSSIESKNCSTNGVNWSMWEDTSASRTEAIRVELYRCRGKGRKTGLSVLH